MVNCFVPQCNHNSSNNDCVFCKFPKDEPKKKTWIRVIRREDKQPNSASRVCSCHFVENCDIPRVFAWNKRTTFTFKSPEKFKRKKKTHILTSDSVAKGLKFANDDSTPSTCDTIWETSMTSIDSRCKNTASQTDLETVATGCQTDFEMVDTGSQTDFDAVKMELFILKEEVLLLKGELTKIKARNENLEKRSSEFDVIVKSEKLCEHYTGVSCKVLVILLELMEKVASLKINTGTSTRTVEILSRKDQLLLFLMKLRRNLSYQDLAFRFGVSITTVQSIFTTHLTILHGILFQNFMDAIPSRPKNQLFIPKCLQSYPNVRIVLDCTEIACDVPKNMEKQKLTFSNYKSMNTVKYAIGCANNGAVTFCSPGYPGSTSDKAIIQNCGILEQLAPADMILADKGFLIADILPSGVTVNIPPFLNAPLFTEYDVFRTRKIARARVHVERVNERLKRFLITKHISHKVMKSIDQVVQLCCALINLQNPLLAECNEFFENLCNDA